MVELRFTYGIITEIKKIMQILKIQKQGLNNKLMIRKDTASWC
ncbi:MAG: hypothetical protein OEQ12_01520 [Nitrosopumilus sp.]|nr:hypothetical protein [Nitrosopumilus sp.]